LRGLGHGLDEIAVNVIKTAPKWTGSGKYVKFTVPVAFSLAAISDKNWSEYYTTKGDKYAEQSQWNDAINCYNSAIDKNKKNANAYYGLSKAYAAKSDSVNAKVYLKIAYKKGYKKS